MITSPPSPEPESNLAEKTESKTKDENVGEAEPAKGDTDDVKEKVVVVLTEVDVATQTEGTTKPVPGSDPNAIPDGTQIGLSSGRKISRGTSTTTDGGEDEEQFFDAEDSEDSEGESSAVIVSAGTTSGESTWSEKKDEVPGKSETDKKDEKEDKKEGEDKKEEKGEDKKEKEEKEERAGKEEEKKEEVKKDESEPEDIISYKITQEP